MLEFVITRGLPGSGKSTWARSWVAADRPNRVCVEREHLRAMIDGGVFIQDVTEPRIVAARDALIHGLLTFGVSVVCSDTNLQSQTVRDLADMGRRHRAQVRIEDFRLVPLSTCIRRDAERADGDRIGETVIRKLHDQYLASP